MTVGGLQRHCISIEGIRTVVSEGIETELLQGILVAVHNASAGRNYIFHEHGVIDDRWR